MKTIKIIDLLNKIANGEEVPEHVKYRNWNNNSFEIMLVCTENIFYKLDQLEIYLNDEVETLDEEDEFEDIEDIISIETPIDYEIIMTLNKLIKNQKKIIERLKDES